jgi:hypothetical protein
MLVGASNSGSDSNVAMHRLRTRKYLRVRGVGDIICDDSGNCSDTSIYSGTTYTGDTGPTPMGPTSLSPTGVPSTTNTSTLSSSNLGASIAAMFSNLGTAAAKAFSSTQTQCSVGTTLVGNQCLPSTAVNALVASSSTAALTSSLMSYAPLLIGLVVVVMVMNASKSH